MLKSVGSVSYTHLDVYKRQVYLRFKDKTTTNELEIVVPKGTVKDTYVPEVKVKVSDVQNFTLKQMCIRDRN